MKIFNQTNLPCLLQQLRQFSQHLPVVAAVHRKNHGMIGVNVSFQDLETATEFAKYVETNMKVLIVNSEAIALSWDKKLGWHTKVRVVFSDQYKGHVLKIFGLSESDSVSIYVVKSVSKSISHKYLN